MPNTIINRRVVLVGGIVFDPDAITFFSYLSPQPSIAQKIRYNTLILALKSAGIWSILDRLFILAAEIQQNSLVSIVNPSATQITEVNSPTWTQYQGYDFNGTTQYLNSGWAPSAGVNYTQNDAGLFTYLREDTQSNVDMGTYTSVIIGRTAIFARFTDDRFYLHINDGDTLDSVANASSLGLISAIRTTSTGMTYYKNGTSLGTSTETSNALSTNNLYVGCMNLNGVATTFSNRQSALFGVGSSAINQASLYAAVQAYMTSLGTQV